MEIPNKHISFKKLQCPFVCHFFVVCTGTGLGGLLRVIGGGVVVLLLVGMVVRVPPLPPFMSSPLSVSVPPFGYLRNFKSDLDVVKES